MALFFKKRAKQSKPLTYFMGHGRIPCSKSVFHAQIPFFMLKIRFSRQTGGCVGG